MPGYFSVGMSCKQEALSRFRVVVNVTTANAASASDVSRRHISPHVPAAAARPARGQPDRRPGSCSPPGVSDGALMFDLYKGRWMDRGIAARIRGSENPRLGQDMAVVLVLVICVQYPRGRTHNVEDVMFIAGWALIRVVRICPACMLRRGRDIDPGLPQPPLPFLPRVQSREGPTDDGAECAHAGQDIFGLLISGGERDGGCVGEMRELALEEVCWTCGGLAQRGCECEKTMYFPPLFSTGERCCQA